jgi:hypothetical protein
MLKRLFLIAFIIQLTVSSISSQASGRFVVCDWSAAFFNSRLTDVDQVRGSVATFAAENSNKGLACFSYRGTTGVKYERLFPDHKIGFAIGLRFSQYFQNTGKWDLLTDPPNYFFYLYSTEDEVTMYARIHSIWQRNTYVGTPVEFTFFPLKEKHHIKPFLKIGAEMDFKLRTRTEIEFSNHDMETYEPEVREHISKPSVIGFAFYNSVGIRFGRENGVNASVEGMIPLFNVNAGSGGLLTNGFGGGLQFNIYIPLSQKE